MVLLNSSIASSIFPVRALAMPRLWYARHRPGSNWIESWKSSAALRSNFSASSNCWDATIFPAMSERNSPRRFAAQLSSRFV